MATTEFVPEARTNGHANFADINQVRDVYEGIYENLDSVMLYEEEAKDGAAIMTIARANQMYGGFPGCGKTRLISALANSVRSESDNPIAVVPGLSDVTPMQLIGGEIIQRDIDEAGRSVTKITEVPALIRPYHTFIKADEFPRLGEEGRDALLPVLEEGIIRSTQGEVALKGLVGFIATMNYIGQRYRIGSEVASRFHGGIILGNESDEIQAKKAIAHADGWRGKFRQAEAVVANKDLQAVQNTVIANQNNRGRTVVTFADSMRQEAYNYSKRIVEQVVNELAEPGESEDTTRMTGQIGQLARAIAMSAGEDRIKEDHVARAAKLVTTARVLLLSTGNVVLDAERAYENVGVDGNLR